MAFVILAGALCSSCGSFFAVKAAKKKDELMTLSAARRLAIARSEKIENLEIQIMAKDAAVASAIRSLKERERNMATFRWSPLLSFKFPTKPNEQEAFEFQFKPTQLENQKTILRHKIKEAEYEITQKVSLAYIDIISAEQELNYINLRVRRLSGSLDKIKKRREEGSVTAKAVEQVQKRYDNAANSKLKTETKLMRAKQKLKGLTGVDVTTGWKFQKNFVTATMTRDDIPYLQQRALDDDQGVFEANIEKQEANLALQVNYELIRNKYPGDINKISSYVQSALTGAKIEKKAFKVDYNEFLRVIDEPWQGDYKILFIKCMNTSSSSREE